MADWDGRSYREVNELQRHLAIRALDGVDLGHHDRVLDVGCGDGAITTMIAQRIPDGSVLGIDSSPKMIRAARALPGMRNLRFERGDVRFMPYRDEFDLVVSFNVLHWVPELTVALTRIHTALHPMGTALLQFVCAGERPSLEAVAMQVCALPRWQKFFAVFRQPFRHVKPAAYPALAAESGLRVLDSQVDDITWDFGSRTAFARWCNVGFVSWTSRLPAALAGASLRTCSTAMSTSPGDTESSRSSKCGSGSLALARCRRAASKTEQRGVSAFNRHQVTGLRPSHPRFPRLAGHVDLEVVRRSPRA